MQPDPHYREDREKAEDEPRERADDAGAAEQGDTTRETRGTDEPTEEEPARGMTIAEAARKGGNVTKNRYGPDFYSKIGRKGGQRVARERGPDFYSQIGRKGGEARVAQSKKLEKERKDKEE